jgi:hypothetical protein
LPDISINIKKLKRNMESKAEETNKKKPKTKDVGV